MQESPAPPKELGVALVGCGWFALQAHVPALRKLEQASIVDVPFRVLAVCSRSAEARGKAARKLGHEVRHYCRLSEVLSDDEVRIVDLVLPIPMMAEAVEACLSAGRHILSEKPAAANPEQAARLWKAYVTRGAQHPLSWCILENWVRKPAVLQVSELLAQGVIGAPLSYCALLEQRLPAAPDELGWRRDAEREYLGGWLLDVGVHVVRVLRRWFGDVSRAQLCGANAQQLGAPVSGGVWQLTHTLSFTGEVKAMQGQVFFNFIPASADLPDESLKADCGVRIQGEEGWLAWDWQKCKISYGPGLLDCEARQLCKTASGVSLQVTNELQVQGDSWIQGGVRSTLADALQQCALCEGMVKRYSIEKQTHLCPAEEALRDAAVIYAMVRCADSKHRTEIPSIPGSVALIAPGLPRGVPNSTGTQGARRRPLRVLRSSSPRDVVNALREARAVAPTLVVRAVGAYNSWTDINDVTGGLAVESMSLMNRFLGVRTVGNTRACRVQPGMTLRALVRALEPRGLMIPSLPVLLDQTCAGAIGSGSHGSSVRHGTLSDLVEGLSLVLPSGAMRHLTRASDHDGLLRAACLGRGELGVIVELELAVVPQYSVLQQTHLLQEAELSAGAQRGRLQELLAECEHVWLHWRLGVDADCVTDSADADGGEAAESRPRPANVVAMCLQRVPTGTPGAKPYTGKNWFPFSQAALSVLARRVAATEAQGREIPADTEPQRPHTEEQHVSMEYSFPLAKLSAATCKVRELVAYDRKLPGRIVEVKFLAGSSRTFLGPNAPRQKATSSTAAGDVACFNLWWSLPDDPTRGGEMFDTFERCMLELGAVPHWGKLHNIPRAAAALQLGIAGNTLCGQGYLQQQFRCYSNYEDIRKMLAAEPVVPFLAAQGGTRWTAEDVRSDEPVGKVSVLLPAFNAMPWLPIAVRDVLRQDGPLIIELLVGDDGSTDGSHEFLVSLASGMGSQGSVERVEPDSMAGARIDGADRPGSLNPALAMPMRQQAAEREAAFAAPPPDEEILQQPLATLDVLMEVKPQHCLRVLSYSDRINRGQGAMMSLCLSHSTHDLIGHMESDDERPDYALGCLLHALQEHPEWDAVSSQSRCIGWDHPGMRRYVAWQNQLLTPAQMRAGRFLEIPVLHQAGLFRRAAVQLATDGGMFRDDLHWAVDMHFWLNFFHHDLVCGKIAQELYFWRQHPGQQTRKHGRLSIENLRRCKIQFLCCPGGPIHPWGDHTVGGSCVQVWSCGQTLLQWAQDLQADANRPAAVEAIEWRPGDPVPQTQQLCRRERPNLVRLFAYGMEKPRQRVLQVISDWTDELDFFVA